MKIVVFPLIYITVQFDGKVKKEVKPSFVVGILIFVMSFLKCFYGSKLSYFLR